MAKTTSKVIVSDELTAYERWELPVVNGQRTSQSRVTAKELESLHKQAFDEGIALGKEQAYTEKKKELEEHISTLKSIIEVLSEPLKELDTDIVEQLSQLSMSVAKQVVRRELHTEQGEIVGIVREAMSALPASTRKITLHIHPDDSDLIRATFSLGQQDEHDEELRWKVIEDPMVTRGGCKISSENSRIDATVEARLNRIINSLLGDERDSNDE